MKKILFYYTSILFTLSSVLLACKDFETPVPTYTDFTIYSLTTNSDGITIRGEPLTTVPVGENVEIEVITNADMATLWPGDFTYRPWENDSILDSRSYEHYGQLGAQGVRMNATPGGFVIQYAWPEAGTYDVALSLTSHSLDGPDFNKRVYEDWTVTIAP